MILVRLIHELRSSSSSGSSSSSSDRYEDLDRARVIANAGDGLAMHLEGALLRSSSVFPYFMLVALEAGSPLRALLLLLSLPLVWVLRYLCCCSSSIDIRIFTFVALAGIKSSAVECVSQAVLAKFFLEDLNPSTLKVFKACSTRHLLTRMPSNMIRPFAKHYLETQDVLGSEAHLTSSGYCTGLLKMAPEGDARNRMLRSYFKQVGAPQIGIVGENEECGFLDFCKTLTAFPGLQRGYIVRRSSVTQQQQASQKEYIKPLVFHDGRLIHRPTPLHSLVVLLWIPIALPLALTRVAVGLMLPKSLAIIVEAFLGVSVRVRGSPPRCGDGGVLFVCTHRSLLDPVFISYASMRDVTTVTYSVSRLSEILSPIRTARLLRCRAADAATMASLLRDGDLAVCPEGTTCREPYLLRFSALFAELTDVIVPVAVSSKLSIFHATTARGWKGLDPLFFFMNPTPSYEVHFLEQLPREKTCGFGGRPSHEVANLVQKLLADSLGYECTNLTRKDKYQTLAGNDGLVGGDRRAAALRVTQALE